MVDSINGQFGSVDDWIFTKSLAHAFKRQLSNNHESRCNVFRSHEQVLVTPESSGEPLPPFRVTLRQKVMVSTYFEPKSDDERFSLNLNLGLQICTSIWMLMSHVLTFYYIRANEFKCN